MARPTKQKSNRADGRFKISRTIGKDHTGKAIIKYFYSTVSKEDAERKADEFLNKKHEDNILFSVAAYKWLWNYKEGNVKETTFSGSYRRPVELHLVPWFGNFYVRDITQGMIQEFFTEKSKKNSESNLQKMKLCLNAIFEMAILNDYCTKNPCQQIVIKSKVKQTKKRIYTEKEVAAVLDATDDHPYGIYIRILLQMGLRCSELCGLMWEDIDTDRAIMHIKRACVDSNGIPVIDKPKNKTSLRSIPIPPDLNERLKALKENGYLVISKNGKNISPKSFSAKRFKTFFKDTGFRELTPHELRHTCGTILYERTHDIFAVSKFLGHSSIAITTKLYVHESPENLRNALFN